MTGHASHTHARHKQLQAGADVSQQKYECPFTQLLTLVFLCNLLGLEMKKKQKKKHVKLLWFIRHYSETVDECV